MEPWIIWIIAAAALLIIEILSQMVWTLCLSAGSLAGMTAALAGADPLWQAVAMAVTGRGHLHSHHPLVQTMA